MKNSDKKLIVARCVICSSEFTEDQLGVDSCPKCNTKSVPCDPKEDVLLKINWHELRVLTIWASNWAGTHSDTTPSMNLTIDAIVSRLEKQFPDKTPLTLKGEVKALSNKLGVSASITQNGKTTEFKKDKN